VLVTVPTPVARLFGGLVAVLRRADAALTLGATRNAAVAVSAQRARVLEDARALRDLRLLELTATADREDGDGVTARR